MFWRSNKAAVEEGAAEEIAQNDWPTHSQPFAPQDSNSWGGNQALEALAAQFPFITETRTMALIHHQGSPVALVGFAGDVRPTYGKMVILEVATALENLALMEGLRQEADVYRFLLNRSQEAIVVATENGLIYAATAAGRTLLSRAENGEKGALMKQSEQRVPAEISCAAGLGEEIAFHGVTIKGTMHGDPELTEPVIVYQLCESQPDMTVDVETVAGKLTPMQTQVLRLLLRGLQYKEIASRLGNSANTVHHHVSEILRRLSCADRIELLTRFQPRPEFPTAPKEPISVSPVPQTRSIVDFPQPPTKLRFVPKSQEMRTAVAS